MPEILDFQPEETLDFQPEANVPQGTDSLREPSFRQKLRFSTVGQALLGPSAAERQGMVQSPAPTPVELAERFMRFSTLPPQVTGPYRKVTDVGASLLPAPLAGVATGARDVALDFPAGLGAVGLGSTASKVIMGLFSGQYAISLPDLWQSFKAAQARGDTRAAYNVATQAIANGAIVAAGTWAAAKAKPEVQPSKAEVPNAVPIGKAAPVSLVEAPGDRQAVGEGVSTPASPAGIRQGEEAAPESQVPLTATERAAAIKDLEDLGGAFGFEPEEALPATEGAQTPSEALLTPPESSQGVQEASTAPSLLGVLASKWTREYVEGLSVANRKAVVAAVNANKRSGQRNLATSTKPETLFARIQEVLANRQKATPPAVATGEAPESPAAVAPPQSPGTPAVESPAAVEPPSPQTKPLASAMQVETPSPAAAGSTPRSEAATAAPTPATASELPKPVSAAGESVGPGMGAARPGEFAPRGGTPTSLKFATVDAERAQRGLLPMMDAIRRSNPEVWEKAMAEIDRDPSLQDRLTTELLTKPRPLKDWENVAMLQRRADLRNELEKAMYEAAQASDDGRIEDLADANARTAAWSNKLVELEKATGKGGSSTETGRSLNILKAMMNEDFSLASLELQKRADNGFRQLTLQEQKDLVILASEWARKTALLEKAIKENSSKVQDLKFQVEELKNSWQEKRQKDKFTNRPVFQKVVSTTAEVINSVRSIMTSFDLSAVLRQGAFIVFGHPVRGMRSIMPMLRAFHSKRAQFAVEEQIRSRPNYSLYHQAGLFLAEHGEGLSTMEEAYMSRWVHKIPGVAGSERAYTTFLNKLRADSFDAMVNGLARYKSPTPAEANAIANFVNVATGRGNLGKLDRASVALNTIFFAPKFAASRFQLLASQPLYRGTARTRVMVAKEYGRFLAGAGVVYVLGGMAGGTIGTDPRSSEFGKIKFGNTRLDPLAGLSQVTVLGGRIVSGQRTTLRGKVLSLRGAKVPWGESEMNIMANFVRSKLAPAPGAFVDVVNGKDFAGQPVTLASLASRSLAPISWQDLYQAVLDQGVPAGTAFGLLSIFGMGVQTYSIQPRPTR